MWVLRELSEVADPLLVLGITAKNMTLDITSTIRVTRRAFWNTTFKASFVRLEMLANLLINPLKLSMW